MSEPNNESCISCIDKFDDWWEINKYRISSKLSIGLGILSSAGSALVGLKLMVPASIILGCVSGGVFFAGIALSKFENKTVELEKDNKSLKEEITRKMTLIDNFRFPQTPISISDDSIPSSKASTCTQYEPIYEVKFEKNKNEN